MKKNKTIKAIIKYLRITICCFLYSFAVSMILEPNSLAPGGITGISVILTRAVGLGTGIWFFVLNIPILLVGMWKFGIKFILSTIYCTGVISVFTSILGESGYVLTQDPILASLAGASLMAVGMGGVLKSGATTGGLDIIVKLLKRKFPYMKTGSLFLILDATIVASSAFVFQNIDRALYAGIVVFLTTFLLDLVLYGKDGAKLIFIISDKADAIAARLLDELDLGVTYVEGQGAYSGKDKKIIMCVTQKQLSIKAEEIVKEEDPLTFMIVTSASEIYGEGYKSFFTEKI